MADERPLSALLSQVLVAFTVEFDNEFERRMGEAGYPGARLSWIVWENLMRFIGDSTTVRGLTAEATVHGKQVIFQLGCLERWGFVILQADTADDRLVRLSLHRQAGRVLRDGWGSGRGIRSEWLVRLTGKGLTAIEKWQRLCDVIERRWEKRFGKEEIDQLRECLRCVGGDGGEKLSLPALLSRLLVAYATEFDREATLPLAFCANTLRVLSEEPTPLSAIARLTGASPETTDIGWQIRPYVIVEPASGKTRGKVVRLSSRGLKAQNEYHRLTEEIDKRWQMRCGEAAIGSLRNALLDLLWREGENGLLLCEGLAPPEGTVRAGAQAPALGRKEPGSAALQRMRDLVAQTEAFLSDPSGALPHYPLWDMNRGFGA